MFTNMVFPAAPFYFLAGRPAPVLRNISYSGIKCSHERPWLALSLVLSAHLAIFAALRPQPQSLIIESMPEPITVSLLSAPKAAPQKPVSPTIKKLEKLEKPVKKTLKKQLSKLAIPRIKPVILASQTAAMPVTETSAPNAETEKQTSHPAYFARQPLYIND